MLHGCFNCPELYVMHVLNYTVSLFFNKCTAPVEYSGSSRSYFFFVAACTLGPAKNEFGYNEHPAITN